MKRRQPPRECKVSNGSETSASFPKKIRDSETVEIPALPDDIIRKIIEKMPTSDRVPLSLVSRSFRNLDLEVGKRHFSAIVVWMEMDAYSINEDTICAFDSPRNFYSFYRTPKGKFKTPNIGKIFKGASTNLLQIEVSAPRDATCASSLCSYFQSLKCKEIIVSFDHGIRPRLVFSFLSGLKSLPKAVDGVEFDWVCGKRPVPQDLISLPAIDEICLRKYIIQKGTKRQIVRKGIRQNNFLMNGATMLHLVKKCNAVHLRAVNCGAEEIVDALKVVTDSHLDRKFVCMYVDQPTVDELITQAQGMADMENTVFGEDGSRYLTNKNHGVELEINGFERDELFPEGISLAIYKINANGEPLRRI